MKLYRYILILSFIFVFADISKSSLLLDQSTAHIIVVGMEMVCPDEDEDGFMDEACGGDDCDDTDKK